MNLKIKLPYIVCMCSPTSGGVTASFAMLGDIQIAEPGAEIIFAGRRVMDNPSRELPEKFPNCRTYDEMWVC